MNATLLKFEIFAQVERWQRLGDGLHRSSGRKDLAELLPLGLLLVVVAGVVAAIVIVRRRNDMTQPCDDPNKLFRELSRAHALDRGSQKLLRQLADVFQLTQPAQVFLQPVFFTAEKLPPQLRGEAARLEALRQRLF